MAGQTSVSQTFGLLLIFLPFEEAPPPYLCSLAQDGLQALIT